MDQLYWFNYEEKEVSSKHYFGLKKKKKLFCQTCSFFFFPDYEITQHFTSIRKKNDKGLERYGTFSSLRNICKIPMKK